LNQISRIFAPITFYNRKKMISLGRCRKKESRMYVCSLEKMEVNRDNVGSLKS